MKRFILYILLYVGIVAPAYGQPNEPLNFVFVIASYNNAPWVKENLDSIRTQIIPPNTTYEVFYIDDASTDGTGQLVDEYVKKYDLGENWFVFHNKNRVKALTNHYNIINSFEPKRICIIMDGDDKADNPYLLTTLAPIYRTPINGKKIWMTYGNYRKKVDKTTTGHCEAFPQKIIEGNQFRWYHFYCSHLRTFYAGLFQKIKKKHMMWKGNFVPICADVVTMIPMIEMSSQGHFCFIKKTLYVYNNRNPVSKNNKDKKLMPKISNHIRSKKSYAPLEKLWDE